jgi:2-methylcitrate dehydratase PrpD
MEGNRLDPINKLLDYSLTLKYEDLPDEVVTIIKNRTKDTLGTAIAGSSTQGCRKLSQIVKSWGGQQESTVIVYGYKVPAHLAALCNATMARARELDDVHEVAGTHASASIIPAAFALAEYSKFRRGRPINGKELILAIVLGSDILCRLRMAGREEGPEMGWLGETYAPIAIAAMGSRIMKFPGSTAIDATGIAYAQCACNAQANADGAFTVSLQQGLGAQAGILALVLAEEGLTGAKNILQGQYGLYPLYLRGTFHPDILTADLGKRFEIANVTTKFYPCCQGCHAAILGALELAEEFRIELEQIDHVTIYTNTFFASILGTPDKAQPRTSYDAQFSYFFTVATALAKGSVTLDHFSEQGIRDADVLKMANQVRVVADPTKDALRSLIPPLDIEVVMRDKRRYSKTVEFVKGHPNNPASEADYWKKFDDCSHFAAQEISAENLVEIKGLINNLEKLHDVALIMDRLS